MVGVAAFSGVAVGAALGLLIRRDRTFQLAALGLLSLALAAAFLLAGAPLPALGALLLGAFSGMVLLAPSARAQPEAGEPGTGSEPRHWGSIAISAVAALAAAAVLIGAGVASRAGLAATLASQPTLAQVGRQLVMGSGIAVLAVGLLAATTVVGGAALIQRDPREAAEEQIEQSRRRRLESQRRRQAQREQARAAARAARRRSGR
jgi:NADH:ubiquinone oxidoreductase subunit 6 (subunit J)